MNLMTGYLGPTSGAVLVDGISVAKEPERAKRAIGYLPEVPPLYPEMTVEEYLQFCAALKRIPREEQEDQVDEVLDMTGTGDAAGRLIGLLSKGYQQRVGLAQALLGAPRLLILDEPTVGLDPKQILEIRTLIRRLAGAHTILLSSHILSEVQEVCDQVLIISRGRKNPRPADRDAQRGLRPAGYHPGGWGPGRRAAGAGARYRTDSPSGRGRGGLCLPAGAAPGG